MKRKHEFCPMSLLVLSATPFEVHQEMIARHTGVQLLIGGVGVPATIYTLLKALERQPRQLVIQAGIAGSFMPGYNRVETVIVEKDCFADLGTEEKNSFRSVFESGLAEAGSFPFREGWLWNEHPLLPQLPLQKVSGITVNKVTDDNRHNLAFAQKYGAAVESMEGAALHYVCLQEKIPFLQLRTLSNQVGERDKSRWKMAEAIEQLNRELDQLLAFVNSNNPTE